jgi:hypothetical protein
MNKTALTALALGVVALAVSIGGYLGASSSANAKAAQAETAISQLQAANGKLQQANSNLAGQVAKDEQALAKIPSQTKTKTAQYGVCFQTSTGETINLNDGNQVTPLTFADITTPNDINGVVSCPSGYTYIPVTPANNATNSNG